jgi:hypothetical protein
MLSKISLHVALSRPANDRRERHRRKDEEDPSKLRNEEWRVFRRRVHLPENRPDVRPRPACRTLAGEIMAGRRMVPVRSLRLRGHTPPNTPPTMSATSQRRQKDLNLRGGFPRLRALQARPFGRSGMPPMERMDCIWRRRCDLNAREAFRPLTAFEAVPFGRSGTPPQPWYQPFSAAPQPRIER